MQKQKRGKKQYKDTRDWPAYNQQLINRGIFYLHPRFLSTWRQEIEQMNAGKEGNPYLYPPSLIEFLAILHTKAFDYRALQGMLSVLAKQHFNFPVISYTQICRRINQLDARFPLRDKEFDGAIDGTGIKVTNRGEWMNKIWSDTPRRGWIKVTILGDTKGNIVDVRIGNSKQDERKAGRGMIRKQGKKMKKLLADSLHDCNATFDLCKQLGIDPAINIRENASPKGLSARARAVRQYQGLGYEQWSQQTQYGLRWPSSEGIFSAVKRMFGEYVRAVKKRFMYQEALLKFWAYQQVRLYNAA